VDAKLEALGEEAGGMEEPAAADDALDEEAEAEAEAKAHDRIAAKRRMRTAARFSSSAAPAVGGRDMGLGGSGGLRRASRSQSRVSFGGGGTVMVTPTSEKSKAPTAVREGDSNEEEEPFAEDGAEEGGTGVAAFSDDEELPNNEEELQALSDDEGAASPVKAVATKKQPFNPFGKKGADVLASPPRKRKSVFEMLGKIQASPSKKLSRDSSFAAGARNAVAKQRGVL